MSRSHSSNLDDDIDAFLGSQPAPSIPKKDKLKIVLVGDDRIGKRCMIASYTDRFPVDWDPNWWDPSYASVLYRNRVFNLTIWTVSAAQDEAESRHVTYRDADVLFVCFSIAEPRSLEHVTTLWIPEISQHCPEIPFVLVGLQADLRDEFSDETDSLVTREHARVVAAQIGALTYVETSAKLCKSLKEAFEEAMYASMVVEMGLTRARKGIFARLFGGRVRMSRMESLEYYRSTRRDVLGEEEKRKKRELEKRFASAKQSARQYYRKYGCRLAREIIVEILAEFHVAEIELDLPEFNQGYAVLYPSRWMRRIQPEMVQLQFFGYYRDDPVRTPFQIFWNFRTQDDRSSLKFLPRMKKTLAIGSTWDSAQIVVFRSYFSNQIQVDELHNFVADVESDLFNEWTAGRRGESIRCARFRAVGDNEATREFPGLLAERLPVLERLSIRCQGRLRPFSHDLILPTLQELRLEGRALCPTLSLRIPSLESFALIGLESEYINLSEDQLHSLAQIPVLRRICLFRVNLLQASSHLYLLLSDHENLEHCVIEDCFFPPRCLRNCLFLQCHSLRTFAIVLPQVEEAFPEEFICAAERRRESLVDFQYYCENQRGTHGSLLYDQSWRRKGVLVKH